MGTCSIKIDSEDAFFPLKKKKKKSPPEGLVLLRQYARLFNDHNKRNLGNALSANGLVCGISQDHRQSKYAGL